MKNWKSLLQGAIYRSSVTIFGSVYLVAICVIGLAKVDRCLFGIFLSCFLLVIDETSVSPKGGLKGC